MSAHQHVRFCTSSDGVRIAYALSGQGAPIVKAGHRLSHIGFDRTSPVWRHWVEELSRDHTLLRYDARGCGLSDWNAADVSFDAWVRDLEAVVDAAGLARFDLLGVAHGAAVAIAYAVRHPERVNSLVLHSAFVRGKTARASSQQERDENKLLTKLAELGWNREDPSYRQVFAMQFLPEASPEQLRSFNEFQRLSSSPENAARHMSVLWNIDIEALAPKVSSRTLLLHARGDMRVPFDEGRQLAALIPGARLVALESRNHILLEDEPAWGQFLVELRGFLGETASRGTAGATSGCFAQLSLREREVLELIAQGLDNHRIAHSLVVSEKTVRNHINSIFGKLEVQTRAQAIVHARNAGFGNVTR